GRARIRFADFTGIGRGIGPLAGGDRSRVASAGRGAGRPTPPRTGSRSPPGGARARGRTNPRRRRTRSLATTGRTGRRAASLGGPAPGVASGAAGARGAIRRARNGVG